MIHSSPVAVLPEPVEQHGQRVVEQLAAARVGGGLPSTHLIVETAQRLDQPRLWAGFRQNTHDVAQRLL